MTNATHPLSREHIRTAFGRLIPRLSDGMRRLAEALLDLIGEDGSASVQQLHARLFPATDNTKSASAQLNNVLKAITAAAQASGLVLSHQFEGSKQGGIAGRKLRFLGPPPLLVAETETLSAIADAQRINDQQGDPLMQEHKVVLLTFNEHEFNAVRRTFWLDTQSLPTALSYPLKDRPPVSVDVLGSFGNIRLFHHHSRQGNRESQRAAADIQAALQPRAIVAVGIAFGTEEGKRAVADVLVSKFLVDYELGKVHSDGTLSLRGPRPPASRTWVRALEQLDIRQNASTARTTWPRLHFGGLLSGEKLVDNIDYRNRLLQLAQQDDIVGGEMEAAGLFTALDGTRTEWVVVKAICDWADGNKGQDKERRQQHAAANAAQVVHALITSSSLYPDAIDSEAASSGFNAMQPNSPKLPFDAKQLMRRARLSEVDDCALPYEPNWGSQVSLDTLDENAHKLTAASPQEDTGLVAFDDILQWVNDPDSPPLYALLGEYGMGKTTTSQRVFEHLRAQHLRGELARPALYFDLRKVERLVPASDVSAGTVPSLQETIEDCLKNGYVSDGMHTPGYADVVSSIDQGAVVIFDGLDEVLSRIQDKQGLTFTANLLRVLADAKARRPADASVPTPKLLLSCRTQFFRSLREQNNHLTGEHRGAQPARQYRALVLRPFTEQQIRTYLQAALPEANIDQLMQRIASVHNLTDLSKRPFTLKLVSRFLPQIERWQAEGRTVTGATLYREVAREWLIRDKEKQSFQPEDKERLAADLAAHLWRQKLRGLDAPALEAWLGAWLAQQPAGSDCLTKPRNLLQQDLRNATFLRRIDDERTSRFEFSHSSLQEFFLAEHLAQQVLRCVDHTDDSALVDGYFAAWVGPTPSDETLDFLTQILSEHASSTAVVAVLNRWRKAYRAQASELLLRYALKAPSTAPTPLLAGFDLRGAQLRNWTFDGQPSGKTTGTPLLMQGCLLQGADLRGTCFRKVRLEGTDFSGVRLAQASFDSCNLQRTLWNKASLVGTVFRDCNLSESQLYGANAYRAQHAGCKGIPAYLNQSTSLAWLTTPSYSVQAEQRSTLTWFPGQAETASALAFSPDGKRIASAPFRSPTLCLWDTETGEQLLRLRSFYGWFNAVVFSPDGTQIGSYSHDLTAHPSKSGTLCLWDAASGEQLLSVSGLHGGLVTLVFSPDGMRIAASNSDQGVFVWSTASGEQLLNFRPTQGKVASVAFAPDGRLVATVATEGMPHLLDVASGEQLVSLQDTTGKVGCLVLSCDAKRIAVSQQGSLSVWDSTTGDQLLSLQGHKDRFSSVVFSPDGSLIVSTSIERRTVSVWDAATGEELLVFRGHQGELNAVAISPDSRQIASASHEGATYLWNATSGEQLLSLPLQQGGMNAVAFAPDGRNIAAASQDGTVYLWNVKSGKQPTSFVGHQGCVNSVKFSPDGSRIASAANDHTVRIWDTSSAAHLLCLKDHPGDVRSVAFSPDGKRIASVSNQVGFFWDATTGERQHGALALGRVLSMAISPCGTLVSASLCIMDYPLNILDTATGELLRSLPIQIDWNTIPSGLGQIQCAVFSPDSLRIATGGRNGNLAIWDVTTGERLLLIKGHLGGVNSVAYCGQGSRIASASDDSTVRLWDAISGQQLLALQGHLGRVSSVVFSPDGNLIASASHDGTVCLWDANTGACVRCYWAQTSTNGLSGHAVWSPPGAEPEHPEGRVISASGDAWRLLGWQVWDHPSAPGQWTRLPLGPYPSKAAVAA
ncbi:WD40 domain-containing protein [Hydrogenophaga luteola]|uniref:PQQ-binding-like beta-propeller repeat protein n=1 Tax=Hydrogenophaga luteola TaxID=1591122 RepID=A0ABV7W0F8_9BURK